MQNKILVLSVFLFGAGLGYAQETVVEEETAVQKVQQRDMNQNQNMIQAKEKKMLGAENKGQKKENATAEDASQTRAMKQERSKIANKEANGEAVQAKKQEQNRIGSDASSQGAALKDGNGKQKGMNKSAASGETLKNKTRNSGKIHKMNTSENGKAVKGAGHRKGRK